MFLGTTIGGQFLLFLFFKNFQVVTKNYKIRKDNK